MNSEDTLVLIGDPVKSLGDGKVGGYLIRFSGPKAPDLEGEYFDADTDYGVDWDEPVKSITLYNHGFDPKLGMKKLGIGTRSASLKKDEIGVWAEVQLDMRDRYEQVIEQLVKAGKLGWSSGSAPHLVTYERKVGAKRIASWPLGLDASLTPIPCDPRAQAVPLKSLEALETDWEDAEPLKTFGTITYPDGQTQAIELPVPPAGATLEHELDSVLATVQSATERVKGYHATRQADGRDISPKRYEQLLAAKEGLDALLETVKPKASKEALADQLARAMEMVRLSAEADGLIPA
jgi:hypothetical protein